MVSIKTICRLSVRTIPVVLLSLLSNVGMEVRAQSSEVVVRAAGFYQSGSTCGGASQPVYISAEPNPRNEIQVGFFESSAEAIGKQSKAAGWLAALVSTELLGADLSRYRISFSRTDLVDGPSAGGLMTSGLVALLRGETFPADVSMTGTINPDGTIGPVGGIAHKIQGAAENGVKRFAIPFGQRRNRNACTGEAEDMVEVGKTLGVDVAEVGDVREAYAFLTGRMLPESAPPQVDTILPDRIRNELRANFATWVARHDAARRVVGSAQAQDFPRELRSRWKHGEAFLATGTRELQSGHEPAAFNRVWMAVLHAEFVARGVQAMTGLRVSGIPGIHGVVDNEVRALDQHIAAALPRLRPLSVTSVSDAGAVAGIGSNLAVALAFSAQAKRELQQSRDLMQKPGAPDFEEMILLSFDALGHLSVARNLIDGAVVHAGWVGRDPQAWPRQADPIVTARSLYDSAARSNIRYVDVLYTTRVAKERGQDTDSATDWVMRKDPAYLAAAGALEQQYRFFELFEDDYTAALAQLGALMGSVANASLLVAQHYSIGVVTDKTGRIVDYHKKDAFERMISLADQTAEQATREAIAATDGGAAAMLVVGLDAARRNRDESITAQDKFMALSLFWNTTLNARLMTRLAAAP